MRETKTICFTNEKGGVAKSTTAESFAASLVARGKRVLLVDLDAQPGNLSLHVGVKPGSKGAYELLSENPRAADEVLDCTQPVTGFGDVVAATPELDELDPKFERRVGKERILSRALSHVYGHYDYILLDTPPALQVRTINAIVAADELIIPTTPDLDSIGGVKSILGILDDARDVSDHAVEAKGILVTRCERTGLDPEMIERIREVAEEHGVRLFETVIRKGVAARYAHKNFKSLLAHERRAGVTMDYERAVDEYLSMRG